MKVALLAALAALVLPASASAKPLDCLSGGLVAHARKSPDNTRAVYRRCKPEIRDRARQASIRPTTERVRAIFAMGLANAAAPYGRSVAFEYRNLIRARRLDCDNYVALAYYVYRHVGGDRRQARFRGWDGGTIGNHAQMWIGDLMVDPTVGVTAVLSIDDARRGESSGSILTVARNDQLGYGVTIRRALRDGEYDESRVLYRFQSFSRFVGFQRAFLRAST